MSGFMTIFIMRRVVNEAPYSVWDIFAIYDVIYFFNHFLSIVAPFFPRVVYR